MARRREQIVTEVTTQFYEMTDEETRIWQLGISALLDEIIAELNEETNSALPIQISLPDTDYAIDEKVANYEYLPQTA
jgi:hypothetical protein